MLNGYEREFVYVYGAVSPRDGRLDWKICPQMNTQRMSEFLDQIARRYPCEFIIMVVDGASSHRAKDLIVPDNIHLLPLPAYSPELNPQEHLWDDIREKEFPNRVFDSLEGVKKQLRSGLVRLARNGPRIKSITEWPWIITLTVTAHLNQNNLNRVQLALCQFSVRYFGATSGGVVEHIGRLHFFNNGLRTLS